jgi:transitional endoplasmic reticulum ATPase
MVRSSHGLHIVPSPLLAEDTSQHEEETPAAFEAENPDPVQDVLPSWYRELSLIFRSGAAHAFLLCGDVHGVTALQGQSQLRFLQRVLQSEQRDIIVSYHRAAGITFPLPSMREKALHLLGPDWSPPTSTDSLSQAFEQALSSAGVNPPVGASGPAHVFATAQKPDQALVLLEQLLRAPQARGRVAVVIDGADLICPATNKAMMSEDRLTLLATLLHWGQDPRMAEQANPICLLTSQIQDMHPDLRASDNGYRTIELKLPDEPTRLSYVSWYLHEHRHENPIPLQDLSLRELARNTAGLNLRQMEDILLLGALPDPERDTDEPTGITRLLVKSRKDAIIREQHSDVVVMLDPLPGGFTGLGGMEEFTTMIREEVMAPLRAGRLSEVPKGILLVGPPGTGKTESVRAVATELGFNAIALHMAKILGGVVGTSERNLQQVLELTISLAPTILFLDELDTHLGVRGNSSGSPVAANLFGALLQFLGDERHRGKVVIIGATNHPELLDTALLRPGRMDIIFPILPPTESARRSILAVQARMQRMALHEDALTRLVASTERYSAADLFAVLKEARFHATREGRASISLVDAQRALDHIRPITLAQVDGFTRRALDACTNLRYLPTEYVAQMQQRATAQPGQEEHGSPTRSARRL